MIGFFHLPVWLKGGKWGYCRYMLVSSNVYLGVPVIITLLLISDDFG